MDFNVVSILKTGVFGLGFLLVYLAYRLVLSISQGHNPDPLVVYLTVFFMVFEIVILIILLRMKSNH